MTNNGKVIEIAPDDPRETPTYKLSEASVFLGIPTSTLRSWIKGRVYPTASGPREFKPLIEAADDVNGLLSFANLAEAHVLQATRDQRIPVPNVRGAIDYIQEKWPSRHPLITQEFYRFGKQLFVQALDPKLLHVNATRGGQIGIAEVLDECLERLERDATGYPIRIFPLKTSHIVLDVNVASGQPLVKDTRVLASVLWGRNKAGDTVEELASAYGLSQDDVKEAISHFWAA